MVRRALFQAAPKPSWGERVRRAAGVLKSFSLTVVVGRLDDGRASTSTRSRAWPTRGNLSDDLTDLLVALGEAAQERETGVAFLVDEVQFLQGRRARGADRRPPPRRAEAAADHARRRRPPPASPARRRGQVVRGAAVQVPAPRPALGAAGRGCAGRARGRPGRQLRAGRDRRDRRLHRGLPLLPAGVREDRLGSRSGRRADQPAGRRGGAARSSSRSSTSPSSASVPSARRSSSCTTSARWPSSAASEQTAGDVAAVMGRSSEQLGPDPGAPDRQGARLHDRPRARRVHGAAVRPLPRRNYELPSPRQRA